MAQDKMQSSRFENKYIITEATALGIREFVQSFLVHDEYGAGKPNFSYPVHSIYLDSPQLKTYWDTINGDRNRFKLRVRFYNDDPAAPVFFEIKRRVNNCIQKQRAGVHRSAAASLAAGDLPFVEDLTANNPKHLVAAQNFARLVQLIEARPVVHVAYLREAYLPTDGNSARLTMDRLVCTEPVHALRLSTHMTHPQLVWGHTVVLELKFTDRFPNWFGDLVRVFNLRQCGAAKYADGITLMNGERPAHRRQPGAMLDLGWPEDSLFSDACDRQDAEMNTASAK